MGRSEEERRQKYFEQLEDNFLKGRQHPFVQLVKRCLKNEPSDRPTAEEVITTLEEMKADIEGPYGEVARIDAVRQVVTMRALKKRETEVREKTDESAAKDEEIHQLQQELEHQQVMIIKTCSISFLTLLSLLALSPDSPPLLCFMRVIFIYAKFMFKRRKWRAWAALITCGH